MKKQPTTKKQARAGLGVRTRLKAGLKLEGNTQELVALRKALVANG